MKRILRASLIFVAAGLLCFGLMFETHTFAADNNPCSADIANFCKDVQPTNLGAVMNCLEQHESQLSDACRAYEAKMEKTRVESREAQMHQRTYLKACKNDMAKFCKDAGTAQGGQLKCLKAHENELSAPCNESINAIQEEKQKTD
jgi:hypothetical protein